MGPRRTRELLKEQRTRAYRLNGARLSRRAAFVRCGNVAAALWYRCPAAQERVELRASWLRKSDLNLSIVLGNRTAGASGMVSQLFFQYHKGEHGLCNHALKRIEYSRAAIEN
jgi:hypothetical protein